MLKTPENALKMVWFSIWGIFFSLGVFAYFFYNEYLRMIDLRCLFSIDKYDCGGTRAEVYYVKQTNKLFDFQREQWSCWGCVILATIYMLIIAKKFNQINIAVSILKAATKINTILSEIKYIPYITSAILLSVGTATLYICVLCFSIGEIVVIDAEDIDGNQVKVLEKKEIHQYLALVDLLIGWIWIQVVGGFTDMIIAYAVSIWYFTKHKETIVVPPNPFFS